MPNYTDNTFTVRAIPGARAAAAFMPKTSEVFKEEHEVAPVWINDKMQYVPWGADNQMPFGIIDLIESDETLATCQMFNAEVCYGSGLVYTLDRDVSRGTRDEKSANRRATCALPQRTKAAYHRPHEAAGTGEPGEGQHHHTR